MISDIELEYLINGFKNKCRTTIDSGLCEETYELLTELKERRESSLRPATKFVNEK